MKIRIIIADDDNFFRNGLESKLRQRFDVVGVAINGAEIFELLAEIKGEADVVLLDLGMPVFNGSDTYEQLSAGYPGIRVIICSSFAGDRVVYDFIRRGVAGFFPKELLSFDANNLGDAIVQVFSGKRYFVDEDEIVEKFTKRESEIVPKILNGMESREIAEVLNITVKAVESHRTNIYRKMRVKNLSQFFRDAYSGGYEFIRGIRIIKK